MIIVYSLVIRPLMAVSETSPSPSAVQSGLLLDGLGITAATLCAVHCLVGVLFVAALPLIGLGALLDERVEIAFLVSAVVLGLLSVGLGWPRHRRLQPLGCLIVGLLMLLGVRPLLAEGSAVEVWAVVVGAAAMIAAHLSNNRAIRRAHGRFARGVA